MEDPAEATVMCPYHPAHKILVSRYQTHLSKCKAQNSHMDTVSCPFNATHVVSRAELKAHIRSCPDRATVDSFIVEADTAPKIAALLPVNNLDTSAFPDESWDDQVLDVSVIDQVKTDAYTKNVLITKVGASKAERKLHRENERLRHQQVLSQIGPRAGSSQQNQDSQNPQPPKSQLPGAWSQPPAAKGPGRSDLDDAVRALSISSNDTKQSEPAPATKPSAWGKPFARDHSAVIAAPNFGPSTGPSGQVSGRPKADPWNRKTQPPPAPAAEKPSSEPQRQPVQQRGLGSGSHAPNGAWSGGNLFAPAAVGINQDDFPYLMPTSSRGRRARP